MDTYQAVYDAVRSRISNADIGAAVESVMREASIGHYAMMAGERIRETLSEYERPSAVYRPKLTRDGTQWCALFGDDLQSGVAGFGDSPAKAMSAFDAAWYSNI